jgi:hypothetical protein
MRKIAFVEVKNIYEYEKVRDDIRRRVIDLKRARRVPVGDHLSFLFENRDTVLFQIQEMCRAERIVDDDRVQEEIDVYNELIPGPGELSATLMIEIEEKERIPNLLHRYMGIDSGDHVWIQVGREHAISGQFEAGRSKEDKLSAVHFVRFRFGAEAIRDFRTQEVFLVVDHPHARARVKLSEATRESLLEDLAG